VIGEIFPFGLDPHGYAGSCSFSMAEGRREGASLVRIIGQEESGDRHFRGRSFLPTTIPRPQERSKIRIIEKIRAIIICQSMKISLEYFTW
jgi:hypothetical protein